MTQDGRSVSEVRAPGAERRRLQAFLPFVFYAVTALACALYLNARARLVPKWGEWYMASEGQPYTLLQVRAFLSGRLAVFQHPNPAGNDYSWGRGGMHTAWGLGVPILATPLHLLGRLFGAPGFPDDVRFLVFYVAVTIVLARVLHLVSRERPGALVASCAAAGCVMVFPTYVGMISARFIIYDQTIATAALWSVLLLAGVLWLIDDCTPARLLAVCGAAGFSAMIRPPDAVYGATTLALALWIAWQRGVRLRRLLGPVAAYLGVTALYFLGNRLRYGGALHSGFENCIAGFLVNRMNRWGLPFAKVPFSQAAKEMFATLFLLEPTPNQIMMGDPPESVRPYAVGERWREYYAPTYDLVILAIWAAAVLVVAWHVARRRPWRKAHEPTLSLPLVVGAWALPPSIVLFSFYARIGNMVTRYATDIYPAFAAACLCVGMAIVTAVRRRAPSLAGSAQLALAGLVALYISGWRGWATHLSGPIDRKTLDAKLAELDARSREPPVEAPAVLRSNEPHGRAPVFTHLQGWGGDGSFVSGMVFALHYSPCLTLSFAPQSGTWKPSDQESLDALRVTGDFDNLKACGAAAVDGSIRRLTMCETRAPEFVLDGMRLYSIAALDAKLSPIDRPKLQVIEAAPACPAAPAPP